jgi:2-C-methyl-D-erythritol 4-phosphate cytidylyltransferase
MNLYALIVAGGAGKRMGTDIPKQFLELAGKPVLMHSIERFRRFDNTIGIIVVIPENQFVLWENLREKHSFSVSHTLVKGGSSRFFSVKNGLQEVEDNAIVAIHDGVRPLVSTNTIIRCFRAAEEFGNGIPVINMSDSVRMITEKGNIPVNRHSLRIIQTPQVFNARLIKKAYLRDFSPEITDDAMLLEKTGEMIHLVEGNRENIKITNPEDLVIAGALINTIF